MADGASGAVAADQVAGAYLLGPAVSMTQGAADGVGIGVEADQFHAPLGRAAATGQVVEQDLFGFGLGDEQQERIRGVVKAETEQPDPDDTTAGVELDPYGVVAPANTHDSPLLAPTLETLTGLGPLPAQPTVHLDRGYDSGKTRTTLAERGLDGHIAHKGTPARSRPASGGRWSAPTLGNAFGKLCWCTQRRRRVVEFYLALAHAIIIVRRLVGRAWTCSRWQAQAGARNRPGCQRRCSDAA